MALTRLRVTLPLLLSLNAGFVDTAGFLALQGLFTAHVTGNFVTLGASLGLGTSGAVKAARASGVLRGCHPHTTAEFGTAATKASRAEDHPQLKSRSPYCRRGPCDPFCSFWQRRRVAG